MKLHFRLHCCIFLLFCITDPSEAPLCEMSISCDNLLCDALGRSPSAKIVISVRNHQKLDHCWHRHGSTEVAEVRKKNPCKIHEYPYHPNFETVWKFQDFTANQIFCEINLWYFETP